MIVRNDPSANPANKCARFSPAGLLIKLIKRGSSAWCATIETSLPVDVRILAESANTFSEQPCLMRHRNHEAQL